MSKRLAHLLRGIPGIRSSYREARFLARIARERWWVERQRRMDEIHLTREWDFDSPVEQERYRRILNAVKSRLALERWGDALEIGCAEGAFTLQLANYCDSVSAYDISMLACERAAQRCAGHSNVRIAQLNLVKQPIPGTYDLIFAMDVLEFAFGRKELTDTAGKLLNALRKGGLLVLSSCGLMAELQSRWSARWLLGHKGDIAGFLETNFKLRRVYKELYPEAPNAIPGYLQHVIALFEK